MTDGQGGSGRGDVYSGRRSGTEISPRYSDCVQLKTYELGISGIFYLLFLDDHWLGETHTVGSDTTIRGDYLLQSLALVAAVQRGGSSPWPYPWRSRAVLHSPLGSDRKEARWPRMGAGYQTNREIRVWTGASPASGRKAGDGLHQFCLWQGSLEKASGHKLC